MWDFFLENKGFFDRNVNFKILVSLFFQKLEFKYCTSFLCYFNLIHVYFFSFYGLIVFQQNKNILSKPELEPTLHRMRTFKSPVRHHTGDYYFPTPALPYLAVLTIPLSAQLSQPDSAYLHCSPV